MTNIVHFLQCVGFQLKKLEPATTSSNNDPMTLHVSCVRSGYTATMRHTSTTSRSCPDNKKEVRSHKTILNFVILYNPEKRIFRISVTCYRSIIKTSNVQILKPI